jgi:hypothetical protein
MMRYLTYLFCVFMASSSMGQTLDAKVSQSQLMVGERITLIYSVKFGLNDSIYFNPKTNVIPVRNTTEESSLSSKGIDFEIIDVFKDSFIVQNKSKQWVGQYVITAWDSGVYILPGPIVVINDSTYSFKDLTVICHLVDPIDGMDIYDIKENYSDIPALPFSIISFLKNHWWWLSLILVGLIVLLYFKLRKKEEHVEEKRPISLKEKTLIAIEALENAKLWEKNRLKEHFVELSYILRSYLTSRYDVQLLEKTTYETRLILTKKGLNDETVDIIAKILSESDMVKFAKSKPDVIAILRVSTLAKQIVAETSPLEFDHVE